MAAREEEMLKVATPNKKTNKQRIAERFRMEILQRKLRAGRP